MSAVRFLFPKVRLAELIRSPGGLSVADALRRAEAGLEEIRPTCLADLAALLDMAEASSARLGETFDDAALADLYAITVRAIGAGRVCGAPGVDEAATSLCDLLDHLRNSGRCDREAVAVHVRAWRLLMNPDLPPDGAERVLEGLRKVSARYAARGTPDPA